MADEPTLANGPPGELRIDALHTTTQNLADEPTLANGPPGESRIDALNTATPNLANKPTLANGSPKWSGYAKMIDHPGKLLHTKDLLPGRVTI